MQINPSSTAANARTRPTQTNSLSGTIPPGLCGPNSGLRVLMLHSNQLTGSAEAVTRCKMLTQLDLGMNCLTGKLPATRVSGGYHLLRQVFM